MSSIITDLLHLTRMEFAMKYWYLELILIMIAALVMHKQYKIQAKRINDKYDKLDELLKK